MKVNSLQRRRYSYKGVGALVGMLSFYIENDFFMTLYLIHSNNDRVDNFYTTCRLHVEE